MRGCGLGDEARSREILVVVDEPANGTRHNTNCQPCAASSTTDRPLGKMRNKIPRG